MKEVLQSIKTLQFYKHLKLNFLCSWPCIFGTGLRKIVVSFTLQGCSKKLKDGLPFSKYQGPSIKYQRKPCHLETQTRTVSQTQTVTLSLWNIQSFLSIGIRHRDRGNQRCSESKASVKWSQEIPDTTEKEVYPISQSYDARADIMMDEDFNSNI